jgi:hypothetical protein
LHRCENKGLAERAIRILVESKDNEIDRVRSMVTGLQTGRKERVWKLLILQETLRGYTPIPGVLQKEAVSC